MKRLAKASPAAGEFLFEIDSAPLEECVTALVGVPLLVRAARSLDAEAAHKSLYQFHDEEKMEQAQQELAPGRVSHIPEESVPLQGLAQVNEEVVQELGRGCVEQKIATIDVDATVIESGKREAKFTYEGCAG